MVATVNRFVVAVAWCTAAACSTDPPSSPADSDDDTGAASTSFSDTNATPPGSTGMVDDSSTGTGGGISGEDSEGSSTTGVDPNDQIPPPDAEGCHAIFAQDHLPTFEVTMHPEIWEQLQWEWDNGQANEDAKLETKPYHSLISFTYEDVVITDAAIRLRGNPTYWDPLPGDKMQFQIGFHTQDPEGRFLGIQRLVLDAATYNRHLLRDRLSLRFMRDVGVRAPCANNARLMVNGEYYGIFTNVEKVDEVYLQRVMEDPTGDLWKRANWTLKTNTESEDDTRLDAMRDATTLEELSQYLDIEQALLTYAAEAVVPDSDGSWAGGLNFYLYDDPKRGTFMLLPWDLDNTFERFNDEPDGEYPINPDPYLWEKLSTHGRPFYEISLQDPAYFEFYIDTLDDITHFGYEPEKMLGWVDQMSAQIEQAVLDDVNKPYDNDLYYNRLEDLREYIPGRYEYLDQWLVCWQTGGVDDGTGNCVLL